MRSMAALRRRLSARASRARPGGKEARERKNGSGAGAGEEIVGEREGVVAGGRGVGPRLGHQAKS